VAFRINSVAWSQIEGEGHGGKLPLMIDRQRGVARLERCDAGQRNLLSVGGSDVEFAKCGRVRLKLRVNLEYDVVLVIPLINRGYLALAQGVVERVVNGLRRDSQAGGGVAVNDDPGLEAAGLLIAADVF